MNTHFDNYFIPDLRTLTGKRIVIRMDWNVPVKDGKIIDTSRIDATTSFIKKLSSNGVKIILLTHFGEKGENLSIIAKHITEIFPFIKFIPSMNFEELRSSSLSLENGNGILLENVRLFEGETENNENLSKEFSTLGEIFVNDAFSVAHRKHSSVIGIPNYLPSYFGPTFEKELINLTKALTPTKPALLIVGGAKIETKLSLIKKYLDQGVKVFVGGAMVHNIWKERGIEIGESFYDPNYHVPQNIINHPLLMTPEDVVLSDGTIVNMNNIPKNGKVVDCGPKTIENISSEIKISNTAIINGPLGLYENGWLKGSEGVLLAVSNSQISSYIGGGDTVTVANSLHILDKFTFVSLGGGAMLDFLSSGTLPGIDAVTK